MALVQISRRTLRADRVKPGEDPVYELHLEPHQTIVHFALLTVLGGRHRKTEDHIAVVWIANNLGEAQGGD